MITVTNLSLSFGGQTLFKNVNLKFTNGNCYGVIGANGAGKSTFLRILSNDLEPTAGNISIADKTRMSVLKQDHSMYDDYIIIDAIISGNPRLYEVMKQKDELYAKDDFTEEDGNLAAQLENEFTEMNGWDADTEAGRLLRGLGMDPSVLYEKVSMLNDKEKIKVLLAQALFGKPDIILLDEPTNGLDIASVTWLEDFLLDYEGTVIVVSHDRHFLNNVCTHIVDVDFNQIKIYVGNYDFWYESSQLMQRMNREQNKKAEDKIKELEKFIERFSANKSKSRQATSRKKLIEKITPEQMPSSSRRYPFVGFQMDRQAGKDILMVKDLSKTIDGVKVLDKVSFTVDKDDKIAFVSANEIANTTLFKILMEEIQPDEGSFKWGVSITKSYFPYNNEQYFENSELNILDWIKQYSSDPKETYLRGFLGRMLFSGEDVYKPVKVLSGGEKVRCMLSRMMLFGSNMLVLDQPTNHLDLESITALNNGLIEFKGNMLFSSFDYQFIQTTANRIIDIREDGVIDKKMTFEEYLKYKEENGIK